MPQPVPPLPAVAGEISGKLFHFDPNPFLLESLRLDFNGSAEATVQFGFTDGRQTPAAPVGLDGLYRMTPGLDLDRAFHVFVDFKNLTVGLRGAWVDEKTFRLEYDTLVNRYFYLLGNAVQRRAGEHKGLGTRHQRRRHIRRPAPKSIIEPSKSV